jgi:phosphatidylinositol alpha-mannosyltransferase
MAGSPCPPPARHFIDRYFPGDYKVIPNGVDLDRFRRAVPLSRWQDGTPNVLFVGRFEPRKGVLDILKAHRSCAATAASPGCCSSGGGPQEREARRYVATRRLGGVAFLGRVSDSERDQLFKTADVYVSPATGRESFGIVLLEAMAAGAPIVASDIHGYKGVVRRGREALLVPPRDPKELAEAIDRLLTDRELAAEMSANGLRRAEEFSWPRVTAKVDDYYGFVIRRLAAGGPLPAHFTAPIPPSPRRRRASTGRNHAPCRRRPPSARPCRPRPPCRRRHHRHRGSASSAFAIRQIRAE